MENEHAFVYVANSESRELLVFKMQPGTGELMLVEHVLGGKFTTLAWTPDRRFMFAGLRDEPYAIASFTIDPQRGVLRPIGETRMPGPLAFLSVDRSGRWLLTASYHDDFVAVSAIHEGELSEPHQVIRSIPKAHSVLAAPANDFVVAAALGADALIVWPFDAETGRLRETTAAEVKVSTGAGPRHIRFHPRGDRLFVLCERDASLRSFDYDAATGRLQERALAHAVPRGYRGKRWAAELLLTPEGRFLYASERSSSSLAAFAVDAETGRMETIGAVPTERQPRAMAMDPDGRFLFVAGQLSNRMSAYALDRDTGVPTKLQDYVVGLEPCWIECVRL
ncbi:MAG TPA: lactonase family protein [Steroidobacteraceae bacterium]